MRFNPLWIALLFMFMFSGAFFILPLLFLAVAAFAVLIGGGTTLGGVLWRFRPMWSSFSTAKARANLALCHATARIIAEKYEVRLDGYSTTRGFFLNGTDDPGAVYEAASQAVTRLRSNESGLKLCSWCGVSSLFSGTIITILVALLLSACGLGATLSLILGIAAAYFTSPAASPYVQSFALSSADVTGCQVQGALYVSRTVSMLGGRLGTVERGVEVTVSAHGAIEAEIVYD